MKLSEKDIEFAVSYAKSITDVCGTNSMIVVKIGEKAMPLSINYGKKTESTFSDKFGVEFAAFTECRLKELNEQVNEFTVHLPYINWENGNTQYFLAYKNGKQMIFKITNKKGIYHFGI